MHFSKELLEKIYKSSLQPEDFKILKEEITFIELFLAADSGVLDKSDSNLIGKVVPESKMRQFQLACKNSNILKNKHALKLIAKQEVWQKMEQIRLACNNSNILADKEALNLIAWQDDFSKMRELRYACEKPNILADKEALRLIAQQDDWKKMEQLRYACEVLTILKNKKVLKLIAQQDDWKKMEQLRLACENSDILKDKEALRLIAQQASWKEMEQCRLIYRNSVKEISDLIVNQVTLEEQEQPHNTIFDKIKVFKKGAYQPKKLILISLKKANELLQQDNVMDSENDISVLKNNAIRNLEYIPSPKIKK